MAAIFPFGMQRRKRKREIHFYADPVTIDAEFTGFSLHKVSRYKSQFQNSTLLPSDMIPWLYDAHQSLQGQLSKRDVIVASYPKSGTTWLSEIVYLLANNLDFNSAKSENLEWRVPYIEYVWPSKVEILSRAEPRVLKTHLPLDLLPDDVRQGRSARIIYILRDPRDVVLSYYNFAKNFVPSGFQDQEGLAGFVDRFVQDRLPYSPWKENIRSYLMVAAEPGSHVLVVTYEELRADLPKAIRKIDRFLNPSRSLSDRQVDALAKHCSFEQMRNNPSTNFDWWEQAGLWKSQNQTHFLNKGQVGSYKEALTPEMKHQLEEKMRRESMEWTLIERRLTA